MKGHPALPIELAGAAALPVEPGWRAVDLVSDLHLAEDLPATTGAFARWLADSPADALLLLGDIFEVWVGDDAADSGFAAHCLQLLQAAAARKPVWLLPGNRDFLLGARFFDRSGVRLLADPARAEAWGQRVLLSHGDALCLADAPYQAFRAQVRTPAWQAAFLARPLAERQAIAAQMRAASQAHQRGNPGQPVTWADADPALAQRWLQAAGADVLVHGHTHRPASEQHAGWTRHVLSDWDLDTPAPAGTGTADGVPAPAPRAEVMRWTAAGFHRLTLAQACQPL